MSDDIAIKVENVSKTFKLPHEKNSSIKGSFINFYKRNKTYEKQEALKDVSFDVKQGEFFGIVGRNGSGKSTLLKMLAGIYSPSQGNIQVNGKLTPFIELGVGFNMELTGRENVYLNGALLGFNRKEMNKMYKSIVEFAELEKFMDQKLKNYSSGMQVRLAFSIAIRAKSDILLIDEVLAVGDAAFQTKCFDYFHDLKKKGTTVIFVSHDRSSLERFCDRGILINNGKLITAGSISDIFQSYSSIVLDELEDKKPLHSTKRKKNTTEGAYCTIHNIKSTDGAGTASGQFKFGKPINISFKVSVLRNLENPILGVTLWQKNVDKPVYATNTLIEGIKETGVYERGDTISFSTQLPHFLNDGEYSIEPAIANDSGTVFYDQKIDGAKFLISGSNNPYSVVSAQNSIKIDSE